MAEMQLINEAAVEVEDKLNDINNCINLIR